MHASCKTRSLTYSVAYMQTQGIRNDTEEPGLLQLEKGRGYATKCL